MKASESVLLRLVQFLLAGGLVGVLNAKVTQIESLGLHIAGVVLVTALTAWIVRITFNKFMVAVGVWWRA